MNTSQKFEQAAAVCDRAAEAVGTEHEMREMMQVLRHMEEIQIALTNQAIARVAQTPRVQERRALAHEGDEFGRIEASIPKDLAFGLMNQKNFGYEGLMSDEGMRDLHKAYPFTKVKTVSGKTQVGYRKPGVTFGRGTLQLAT